MKLFFFSQHMQMFIETLIRVRFLKMKQKKGLTFLGSLIRMIVNDKWADSYIGVFYSEHSMHFCF